jgi:hypothetical protein
VVALETEALDEADDAYDPIEFAEEEDTTLDLAHSLAATASSVYGVPMTSKRAKLASACVALHAWRVVGGPQPLPAIWGKHPAASIPVFVDDEHTVRIDRVLSDVTEVIGFPPGGWLLAAFFDWATRVNGKCHGWSLP